jgi:threonyl-tRNA synthetase
MNVRITISGHVHEKPAGVTPADLLAHHAKDKGKALAALWNDTPVDLSRALTTDGTLSFLTFDDPQGKQVFWHSTSHILAQAIKRLYPQAKPTLGPPIDEGFYYDFDNLQITEEDLKKIEKEMQKITAASFPCVRKEYANKEEAKYDYVGNEYKAEIIDQSTESLSAYQQGEFLDLCRGPHLSTTNPPQSIKLLRLAGAYWRGDSKNKMLTRIYGISFPSPAHLKLWEEQKAEAERRDHRKIAAEMELYTISEDIGPGLILWLPKGNIIKEELENWAKETEAAWGYQRVTTPIITKEGLFHTSEHLPHYKDSMYNPMQIDGENYYIKPMNCPFHHKIFAARTRSYRELPLRLTEYGWCHRYEQSGALFGLMRVRGMQMNDAHIYCTYEQAVDEFVAVLKLHEFYYQRLGITDYRMELSLRDPTSSKYHGDEAMWAQAEEFTRQAMEHSGIPFKVDIGGAAFYGPKMDFQVKSAIGREFTASTNQIDLFMPTKFNLKYMGEDGQEHVPACIHRAPLGTHERFIGFLIEHFAGRFPLWLAPEQVAVLPISTDQQAAAAELYEKLKEYGVRAVLEDGNDTLNKRVRDCQLRRIPAIVVLGEKEVSSGTVAMRTLDGKTEYGMPRQAFIDRIVRAKKERSLTF